MPSTVRVLPERTFPHVLILGSTDGEDFFREGHPFFTGAGRDVSVEFRKPGNRTGSNFLSIIVLVQLRFWIPDR